MALAMISADMYRYTTGDATPPGEPDPNLTTLAELRAKVKELEDELAKCKHRERDMKTESFWWNTYGSGNR